MLNPENAPLFIVPRVLDALRALRARPKGERLPGVDELLDRLLAGIEGHPTRFWVMKQFQQTLASVETGDTEARQRVCKALEEIMAIVGIDSSDGALAWYLRGL